MKADIRGTEHGVAVRNILGAGVSHAKDGVATVGSYLGHFFSGLVKGASAPKPAATKKPAARK